MIANSSNNSDDYFGIDESSSDDEKISSFMKVLKDQNFQYVDYVKLFISYDQEKFFNAKLDESGFVERNNIGNLDNPTYRLSGKGLILLIKHESYLNYINSEKGKKIEALKAKKIQDKIDADKKIIDDKRQEVKDEAEEWKLKLTKFQVNTRFFPYAASLFAVIVSIFSYFKPEKKPVDLLPLQQQIQELQKRVKMQNFSYPQDSVQKKDTALRQ